jgi:hypothetical protein
MRAPSVPILNKAPLYSKTRILVLSLVLLVLSLVVVKPGYTLSTQPLPLEHNLKPVPEGEALVTLYINGVRYGDIDCKIDVDNPFLNVEALKESLKDYLSPEQFQNVFSIVLSKLEWAGFDDLAAANLTGTFSLSDLSYHLEVPASFAAEQNIDFTPAIHIADTQYFKPSFFSGLINLTGSALLSISPDAVTIPGGVSADIFLKIGEVGFTTTS